MEIMQKILAVIAVTLCISLAACAQQTTEETPPQSSTDTVIQESETDAENTEKIEEVEDESYVFIELDCRIELSGDPDDIFVTEQECYTDNDEIIIFFQKGVTVRGDMLTITEKVMDDITRESGFDFNKNYDHDYFRVTDMYFENRDLATIDPENRKVQILIVDPSEELCDWAFEGGMVAASSVYDYDFDCYQILYHELSHVAHTRNGTSLTPIMNEGYGVYMSYHTMRANGIPSEETRQYFSSPEYPSGRFDDSIIYNGESGFIMSYRDRINVYHYGFRLITFLCDEYGDDAFKNIMNEATARDFDEMFSDENEEEDMINNELEMIEIIKSQTSDDVFEEFAVWYEQNWDDLYEDYLNYMKETEQ